MKKSLFRGIYVLPTLVVMVARVVRQAPTVGAPALILGLVFGALFLSLVVGSAVLPALLRRAHKDELAAQWRRAALQALDFPTFWLFLWAAVYLPLGPLGGRLIVGAAATLITFLVLRYVDRRWLHVDLFKA